LTFLIYHILCRVSKIPFKEHNGDLCSFLAENTTTGRDGLSSFLKINMLSVYGCESTDYTFILLGLRSDDLMEWEYESPLQNTKITNLRRNGRLLCLAAFKKEIATGDVFGILSKNISLK
jgi:hypothetical protein